MTARHARLATRTLIAAALIVTATTAYAQTPPASKFGITDNSFLVEEAFNQETGVFQNIFVMTRSRTGVWSGSFTQEWPMPGQRHQLSITAPMSFMSGTGSVGDGMINYRFQAWDGEDGRPAFSPRLSLILPTSADRRGFGMDGAGWQVNLPFSKEHGSVFFHWNAGATMLRESGADTPWQATPFVAGSVIVAVRPLLNLMVEAYSESRPGDAGRELATTIAPGLRVGMNVGDQQWVLGLAVPITRGASRDTGVLAYLSYELPFRKISSSK